MSKEYSIYFNSRKIVIKSNFNDFFKGCNGLFIKYEHPKELTKLLVFFQSTSSVSNLYIVGSNLKEMYKSLTKHFELVEAAGGIVQNEDGAVLLIKRNGLWDLPKGKVDEGETVENAALREVSEECGIDHLEIIEPVRRTYHTYTENDQQVLKKTNWFKMRFSGKEQPKPQVEESITEVTWVDKNLLKEYLENSYPSIKDVVSSLETH